MVRNSYILSLETATEICSVAISHNGICIAEKNINEQNAHGSVLTVFIDQILKENRLDIKDLTAVAYSCGPGSYTGLRIGLSVAKGICFGANLPLIAIPTLEHIASNFSNELCFPMIDARRMEVYGALLYNGKFEIQPFACIVDHYDWETLLCDKKIKFIGNGAAKSKPLLHKFSNAVFVDDYLISAKSVGELAYKYYLNEQFANLAHESPFYLKEANVTEAKRKSL